MITFVKRDAEWMGKFIYNFLIYQLHIISEMPMKSEEKLIMDITYGTNKTYFDFLKDNLKFDNSSRIQSLNLIVCNR